MKAGSRQRDGTLQEGANEPLHVLIKGETERQVIELIE